MLVVVREHVLLKEFANVYLDLLVVIVVNRHVHLKLVVDMVHVVKVRLNANAIKIGKEKHVMIRCVIQNATKMVIAIRVNVSVKTNSPVIIVYTKLVLWNVVVMGCVTKELVSAIKDTLEMIVVKDCVLTVAVAMVNVQEHLNINASAIQDSKDWIVRKKFAFLNVV